MTLRWPHTIIRLACAVILVVAVPASAAEDQAQKSASSAETGVAPESQQVAEKPRRKLYRGKVVLLNEALAKRDLRAAEEMDDHVVLETPQGELIPILADWRGRAFYQDRRLRDRDVELVGFRHRGIPYLQVLMVFTFDDQGERQYTDYWCDVCSIPMYEIKPCECCQGEIRLRFQERELPDYIQPPDESKRSAP